MNKQRIEILERALSESGCIPFHAMDAPLVAELCEIIGILHRELESQGVNAEAIKKGVGDSI